MKRIIRISLLFFWMIINKSAAQTWNGLLSTDWNTSGNWAPANVPTTAGNVMIPGTVATGNWPVLAGNININSIQMQQGSQLDVNGFSVTISSINANNNFNGATLINSNAAADIEININTGSGGFITYFSSNTVNDNIVFNITGSNLFSEQEGPGNVYNGNSTFNINGSMMVLISYGAASLFNGNLTINRTVAGDTWLFYAGGQVNGNFSLTNNAGGLTGMGTFGASTLITGTINIAAIYTISPSHFEMFRVRNLNPGGTINIQNSEGFNFQGDTLLLSTLNITGYKGNNYAYLMGNRITGNINIADDASYSGGFYTYVRNNVINGNSTFSINGFNGFLEGDVAGTGNIYEGNVTFNGAGGALYISHGAALQCSGNLAIFRTAPGLTQAFNAGAYIGGNFSYTNNTSGDTYLGNLAYKTNIGGTVNVNANYSSPNNFLMHRLANQTNGGSIHVQNSLGFSLQNDSLLLAEINLTGYKGGQYAYFFSNSITGNLHISDDPAFGGGFSTTIRSNVINGNSIFSINGPNFFTEADGPGYANRYLGNLTFNCTSGATLYIAILDSLLCTGDLTINRTAAGITVAFNAGATIGGNLSYSNSVGGVTYLGNASNKTFVNGRLDINAAYIVPAEFEMYRVINQTNGGIVSVQNSKGFNVQYDSLSLASFTITGYRGGQYAVLYNNAINGNVTISDDAGYSGGFSTNIGNNRITGNSVFTINGYNSFAEAGGAGSGNKYIGNATFNATSAAGMYIAYLDSIYCTGNLSINRTSAGLTVAFNAGATINGNFSYTNNSGGNTYFGNKLYKSKIGGLINIDATYLSPNEFVMHRLVNQTGGGNILVQNSGGFSVENDTLLLNSINLLGYGGSQYANFSNNLITGNVTTADNAGYAGGYYTYFRNNTINGNCSITNNGFNILLDADAAGTGNRYNGNLSYTKNGAPIISGAGAFNEVSSNLTLNAANGISLGKIKFVGNTPAVIEQVSTQPVQIAEMIIDKTASAALTLNDSISVTTSLDFINGYINSSSDHQLIVADNAVCSGYSDASFVNGPVKKIGNDAFIFPVGKSGKIAIAGMSAPANTTDAFSAEYFLSPAHNNGYDSTQKDPGIHHISATEYWMLTRNGGSSSVSVSLSWNSTRSGVVNNLADLKIARWNGALWKDEGNGGTTGTNDAGAISSLGSISNFSPFTLASGSLANPLPLRFISFNLAQRPYNDVSLNWETSPVPLNTYFEIWRSKDGSDWIRIAESRAQTTSRYEYTDKSLSEGNWFYRIKHKSIAGNNSFSETKQIRISGTGQVKIWPNPATSLLNIYIPYEQARLDMIDMSGRIIWTLFVEHKNNLVVPLNNISNGMYILRVKYAGGTTAINFIKE